MANASPEISLPHLTVCVCTYKRPDLLRNLLEKLAEQETESLFTYSVVVVDNDQTASARQTVTDFGAHSKLPLEYFIEPVQNIALARNRAVANAKGEFVAFIDDDEFPIQRWLLTLLETCKANTVDGVLGPVLPWFSDDAPRWVVKGRFYDHRTEPTGFPVKPRDGRTGNALVARNVFNAITGPFREEFRGGEDKDFFRRAIESGFVFTWCREAVVYEVIPPVRWRRTFMIKKALLRGAMASLQPGCNATNIAKSFLAVLIYGALLPFASFAGHHKFMSVVVRLCDHLGKLLAVLGINVIQEPYVTQ